jgi:hypothetical protein
MQEIMRVKMLLSITDTTESTKDGELPILISMPRKEHLVTIKNMDSISTDFSTSDLDFQCGELLQLSELILNSRDITKEEIDTRHGNSIEYRTLSSLITLEATQ